jgi:hypothetical protein
MSNDRARDLQEKYDIAKAAYDQSKAGGLLTRALEWVQGQKPGAALCTWKSGASAYMRKRPSHRDWSKTCLHGEILGWEDR